MTTKDDRPVTVVGAGIVGICCALALIEKGVEVRLIDRDAPGQGFTHKRDDIVTISAPELGKLVNRMRTSDECEPWTFGIGALMKNLAQRKLL